MSEQGPSEVSALVDHLFRHQAGQMVSSLCRALGLENLDLAEEVVQEAMLKALRHWPLHGIPENPAHWLSQVARNHALDVLRRRTAFRRKEAELEGRLRARCTANADVLIGDDSTLADDQLAMIFACCHPAIPADARVALTLKSVGGFSVPEIARAFLLQETAVAQRLVRAKRRIQEAGIALSIPEVHELRQRLDSVLQVIYLLFNEGYVAHQGEELIRQDLCAEAIRLGLLLTQRTETAQPKVHALLALMLFHASRLAARVDDTGDLLLLGEQDRALWDEGLRQRGYYHFERAAEGDEITEYHLQAAIAAVHAVAPSYESTDWRHLRQLYDQLAQIAPSPVVALNRAIAIAMDEGCDAGLKILENLDNELALRNYYLLSAVRADLLRRLGRYREAGNHYRAALSLPCTAPERRFLMKRLADCEAAQ